MNKHSMMDGGEALLDLVFPNSAGELEDAHNLLRRGLHKALDRAGLRRIRFHDLRHTTASLLLANGVGIKQVQAQLGHASAQITLDVYSHLIPAAGAPGADAFHTMAGGGKKVAGDGGETGRAPGGGATGEWTGTSTHGSQDVPEAVGSVSNVVAINGAR